MGTQKPHSLRGRGHNTYVLYSTGISVADLYNDIYRAHSKYYPNDAMFERICSMSKHQLTEMLNEIFNTEATTGSTYVRRLRQPAQSVGIDDQVKYGLIRLTQALAGDFINNPQPLCNRAQLTMRVIIDGLCDVADDAGFVSKPRQYFVELLRALWTAGGSEEIDIRRINQYAASKKQQLVGVHDNIYVTPFTIIDDNEA